MKVAEYIADYLVQNDVRHVFGFQGGAILKLLDAMVETGKIEYIQNYHEQASAFCADAYSRITGNIGVALATSGPGATNLITGIANAQLDSVATLFITGQDYTHHIRKSEGVRLNGFQDLDIVSVVKPITKYAVTVMDPNRIRYELEKALHLAKAGRPGATVLDIPIDIQFKDIDPETLEGFVPEEESHELGDIPAVIDLIKAAKRPVILAGGGVKIAKAQEELRQLVATTDIPVVSTLNGLDAYEGAFSFSGLHGSTFSNLALYNADLVLVLGARLGQRQVGKVLTNYTQGKVVHIDIDRTELGRVFPDSLRICADLKLFLRDFNSAAAGQIFPDFTPWQETIRNWESLYGKNTQLNKVGLDPVEFVEKVTSLLDRDAIVTADVGQNQMWVAQAFRVRGNQRLLNSTGLGSMGYSLPASIGAKIARPNSQVVAFTGDGGLQMNLQELLLLGQRQLDITCIVMNNNTLGMMREVQKRYYNSHYIGANEQEFICADLEALAKAFKLEYLRVDSCADVDKVVDAIKTPRPYLVDVRIAFDSLLLNRYDEAHIFEANKIES